MAEQARTYQYFKDTNFEKGFIIGGEEGRTSLTFGKHLAEEPFWMMGENDTRFPIYTAPLIINGDGSMEYRNEAKCVKLFDTGFGTAVQMDCYGDVEFDHIRQDGEAWPHLLLGHDFCGSELIPLREFSSLIYQHDVVINQSENRMGDDLVRDAHVTQTTFYITLVNHTEGSLGYGDFIWFGVPVFDHRHVFPDAFHLLDVGGKHDATGKIIYVLGGEDFLKNNYGGVNPRDGKWAHCEVDVLKYVQQALDCAQSEGHMQNTKVEDLTIGHCNFGWEVTGGLRASMAIRNMSLLGTYK